MSVLAVLGLLAVPAASAVAQVPAGRAGSELEVASDTLAVGNVLFQGIREWSLLAPGMQVMPRDLLDTARPLTPLAVRTPSRVGEGASSPSPGADAWGVEKNFGMAAAEVLLSNLAAWIFNEYPRGSYISQMSPRTWWSNLEAGFGWDDNHFSTNMFAHPFQGALYYNAARSNGYSYWASVPFAFAGSLHWECCGETHLMSINDWFNTALGGAALGEMFYRVSSMVLDNTATGSGRGWREVGAAALDPVRGATRLFKGRSGKVYDNPTHPNDRIPDHLSNTLVAGVRSVGEGRLSESSETHAFFEVDLTYGSMFALERNKPFDFFTLGAQINFGDKKALGRLQVRGNLYSRDLKVTDDRRHVFLAVHNFDYLNNNVYEFGGQSVSALLLSNWDFTDRVRLVTQFDVSGMIMGAVNSEFAFVAEVPGVRERLREYDFGTGAGGRVGGSLIVGEHRVADVHYRLNWISTLNGSELNGSDANHIIHTLAVRAKVPVTGDFGLGADWFLFLRNSYFTHPDAYDISQRSPQLRVYATWDGAR